MNCSIVIASGTMDDVPIRVFKDRDSAVRWADLTLTSQKAISAEARKPLALLEIDVSEWVAVKVATFGPTGELIEITVCHKSCDLIDAEGGGGPELRLAGESDGGAH